MREELEAICKKASAEVREILATPLPDDPDAPAGYLTAGFAAYETRKRFIAAKAVVDRMIQQIEKQYGPVAGTLARDMAAPVFAILDPASGALQ